MTFENAEILALDGLAWLAGQEDGIARFLRLSGLETSSLRDGAGSPELGVAVLDFLLGHEDLLLAFCESAGLAPRQVHLARRALSGHGEES